MVQFERPPSQRAQTSYLISSYISNRQSIIYTVAKETKYSKMHDLEGLTNVSPAQFRE